LTRTRVPTLKGDYPQIYENFHLAIESNDAGKLIVTPEEAILNIKLIETGLNSSRQERTITL
jgi:predicted dehydrogenase